MRAFSQTTRRANISKLQAHEFDLVVIGGGITGAGVARDAASRGMKVALVEARDFAEGTSSRSSKLIHGGIRYLENLEFGLVFEALSERRRLFEMAPHLVHPLRFVIPLYAGGRVGMFKMGLGMWLYDALSMFEAPELHERLNPRATVDRLPVLNPDGLLGSYAYSDAYMDDDRLTIETLRSANQMGAWAVNYVKAAGVQMAGGRVQSVDCVDQLTGASFQIKTRHIVSSVGPWTDQLGESIYSHWSKIMRPSKGVHLTFSRDRIPLKQAVVMGAEERIVFGIPRHEMVIIGTTDTDFKQSPEQVKTTREDVDYLLGVVETYFPGAEITESDILASYAGVRPLVHDGSSSESKTSREHTIFNRPEGITFVAGGKYTTYRHMAEQTVEQALQQFSIEDQVRFGRSQTKQVLNPQATTEVFAQQDYHVQSLAKNSRLSKEDLDFLFERHGHEVEGILNKYEDLAVQYPDGHAKWILEAVHALDTTMCLSLKDFYLRRVPLFLAHTNHGLEFRPSLAQVFQERLALSDAETQAQLTALGDHMRHELGWRGNIDNHLH